MFLKAYFLSPKSLIAFKFFTVFFNNIAFLETALLPVSSYDAPEKRPAETRVSVRHTYLCTRLRRRRRIRACICTGNETAGYSTRRFAHTGTRWPGPRTRWCLTEQKNFLCSPGFGFWVPSPTLLRYGQRPWAAANENACTRRCSKPPAKTPVNALFPERGAISLSNVSVRYLVVDASVV